MGRTSRNPATATAKKTTNRRIFSSNHRKGSVSAKRTMNQTAQQPLASIENRLVPRRVTLFHEDSSVSLAKAEIIAEVDVSEKNRNSVAVNNGGRGIAPTSTKGSAGAGATTESNNSHLSTVGALGAESLAGVPGGSTTFPTNGVGGPVSLSSGAGDNIENNNPHLPPTVLVVGGHGAASLAGIPGGMGTIPTNGFGGSGSSSSSLFLHHGAYSHVC